MLGWPNPKSVAEIRSPIFIVGCGRSGTTLLFELLKRHSNLAPTVGHPDGEDHVGWIRHGGAIISGLANPQGDTGHVGYDYCLHMTEEDLREEMRRSMHRYYATEVLRGRSSARVINKCPHLSNKLRYVRAIFPDARFVHIVRDPVAMVASWVNVMKAVPDLVLYWPESAFPCLWVLRAQRQGATWGPFERDQRLYPGGGLLRLADYWAMVNANIPRQLYDTPSQLLTIRYEDLVAAPVRVLHQITDFCQLDPFPTVPVSIEPERNSAYRSLLHGDQIRAIIARCRTVAENLGYRTTDDSVHTA